MELTTKDFIESKGMSRNRNLDVKNQLGTTLHRLKLSDLLEEYAKLVNENSIIPPVVDSTGDKEIFHCRECDTELSDLEVLSNACLSCGCSPPVFFV